MLSLILLFITAAKAQQCMPDLIVDDVSAVRQKWISGANRFINMAGGDYGVDPQSTFSVQVNTKAVMFTPQNSNNSYFFIKFNEQACFDATRYRAFQFDFMAAPGTTASITYTQMSADCRRRVTDSDSTYIPLSRYYTTPGQIQTVTLPFVEFTQNVKGSRFDMMHLKDFTIVDVKPLRQPIYFRNMRLVGGCAGPNVTRTMTSSMATTTSTMAAIASVSSEIASPVQTMGTDTEILASTDEASRAVTTLAGSLLAATLAVFALFL